MKIEYKFRNFYYNINKIITLRDITLALNKFHTEELVNIDPKTKFVTLLKIKTINGDLIDISSLQILDNTRMDVLNEILKEFWFYKSDIFIGIIVDKIIFKYRFLECNIAPKECIFEYPTNFEKGDELLPLDYINLPNNRLFEVWGDDILINGDNTYLINRDNNTSFFIRQLDNKYFVTLRYKNITLFNFYDMYNLENESNNTFIRTIGSFELYYINGECHILNPSLVWRIINNKNFYNWTKLLIYF
jgi:hypothetical protein